MKANELMIGDHITHFYDGRNCVVTELRGRKIAVSYIDADYKKKYSELLPEMAFEPIPLTAEILEKNGFEAFDYFLKIQISTTYIELRPIQGSMIIWFDWDENNDGAFADIILPYPKYLHELQHALRLVGIKKTIEL